MGNISGRPAGATHHRGSLYVVGQDLDTMKLVALLSLAEMRRRSLMINVGAVWAGKQELRRQDPWIDHCVGSGKRTRAIELGVAWCLK